MTLIELFNQIKGDISYETELNPNYSKLDKGWENWHLGDNLGWFYKEDFDWWKSEFKDEIKLTQSNVGDWIRKGYGFPYQGILFTLPDREFRIEENAVLLQYKYPIEKCNPETDWISFNRFLENEDLYKVYKI